MAHVRHRHGYSDPQSSIAAINTTPLVDVMLVLLIIFLITVPVVLKTVPLTLPRERVVPAQSDPKNITIAINRGGQTYWNNRLVKDQDMLLDLLREAARQNPQPEINIRGDQETTYEPIGRVLLDIQRVGVVKVSFITEPPAKG